MVLVVAPLGAGCAQLSGLDRLETKPSSVPVAGSDSTPSGTLTATVDPESVDPESQAAGNLMGGQPQRLWIVFKGRTARVARRKRPLV